MMRLIQMKMAVKPIMDITEASNTQGGFCIALSLPNTRDILEQREVMCEEHDAQENLGFFKMDAQKLGRVNTKVLCTKNICHIPTVKGGCKNISSALITVVKYNSDDTDGNEIMFLHLSARRITLLMSLVVYCCHQVCSASPARSNYYMLAVLDRAITHIARLLKNEPSIRSAAKESINNIQLECVVLADKVLKTGLTHMLNVVSRVEDVEISLIYMNSKFHRKASAKAAPAATKRQRERSETYEQLTHLTKKEKTERGERIQVLSFGMAVDPYPCLTSMPTPREKNLVVQTLSNMRLGAVAQKANAIWTTAPTTNGPSPSLYSCKNMSR